MKEPVDPLVASPPSCCYCEDPLDPNARLAVLHDARLAHIACAKREKAKHEIAERIAR